MRICLEYLKEAYDLSFCSMNLAATLFLLELSKFCSQGFFREAVLAVADLLDLANNKGHDYEKNMGFYSFPKPGMNYTDQKPARRLAEISAAYLSAHYSNNIESYALWLNKVNRTYPNLYGSGQMNLVRMSSFLQILNRWLIENKLTDTYLEIVGMPKLEADFLVEKRKG